VKRLAPGSGRDVKPLPATNPFTSFTALTGILLGQSLAIRNMPDELSQVGSNRRFAFGCRRTGKANGHVRIFGTTV